MENKYLTVEALTKYLKFKFDTDEHLKSVFLKGEISNFKPHSTGHYYFSLKDEKSKINAIMFNTYTNNLKFVPKDGMKVLVVGRVSIYEATGNYQIYIEDMVEDGVGNLYKKYEELKNKLESEGLFDQNHKLEIPKMPRKIGVITAKTGAAVKDIITTIKRRFPICEIYLFPSLVQGDLASADIVKNIKRASEYDIDVLIVGRGGGSIEDLWAFNEEIVARAIYESNIPIISAVGHEIDFTIADFVSDLRAPTPTAAAELAVPNIFDLYSLIKQFAIRLNENMYKKLNYNKLYLDSTKNSYVLKNPLLMYENKKQALDLKLDKLNSTINNRVKMYSVLLDGFKKSYILNNPKIIYKDQKNSLKNILEKLEIINPMSVLKRGYNISYQDDKVINSVKKLDKNNSLVTKYYDGTVISKIIEIKEEKNG